MTLAPGTRLGSYKILAPMGVGGMGEMWKARDPKLDRFVAIKVLPEDFAADSDRLKRFQQEAKVLAALNHPNLVQVHEWAPGDHSQPPRPMGRCGNFIATPLRNRRRYSYAPSTSRVGPSLAVGHLGSGRHPLEGSCSPSCRPEDEDRCGCN